MHDEAVVLARKPDLQFQRGVSCVLLSPTPGSKIPGSSRARTNVGSAPTYSRIAQAGLSAPSN